MNRCLRCNEEKNNGECVFRGESQYDIQEIKRVHNLIFEGEGLKVCFIDGGLGSGKSYKVDKVLEYRNTSNNKVESLMFESFQTGYNENFIYILFLELVKNEKKKPSFKKHWKVFKNNISISNFILSIPVTLSLLIVFYTVFKVFDFTKQDLISTNVGYLIIIAITVIISLYILPYALTFRKEYTILNRDYYYNLVTKLLPEVLIIDDFERLTENQRRQVYEFINYLRANETEENKVETMLKRILILGDLKAVESAELLFKEGTKERITKEAFVTKYYDQRIVLGDWIETFTERYNIDYAELPLNSAETVHIIKFLKFMSPILTRREFVMFMTGASFNYQEKSFEQELVDNLSATKPFEFEENLKCKSNLEIETGTDIYNDLKLLITRKMPINRTIYSEGNKLSHNKTLKEVAEQYKGMDIDNLELLFNSLIENNGNEKEQIEFFKTEKIAGEFRKYQNLATREGNLGEKLLGYSLKDNFHNFFEVNESRLTSKYQGETIYKMLLSNTKDNKSHLQILTDKYLGEKESTLNPVEIFFEDEYYYSGEFKEEETAKYGYTLEEFNQEFKSNVERFIQFKKNIIFCIIELHNKQFNTKVALNAYDIVHTKDLDLLLTKIKEDTDFELTLKYQDENKGNTKLLSQRVALIKLIADIRRIDISSLWKDYSEAQWFKDVNNVINDINEITIETYSTFTENYEYITLNIILEIRNDLLNGKLFSRLIDAHDFDNADLLFDKVRDDKFNDFILEIDRLSLVNNLHYLHYFDMENMSVLLSTITEDEFPKIKKQGYGDCFQMLSHAELYCHTSADFKLGQYLLDIILMDIEEDKWHDREAFSHALYHASINKKRIKITEKIKEMLLEDYEIDRANGVLNDKFNMLDIYYDDLFDIDISEFFSEVK